MHKKFTAKTPFKSRRHKKGEFSVPKGIRQYKEIAFELKQQAWLVNKLQLHDTDITIDAFKGVFSPQIEKNLTEWYIMKTDCYIKKTT